MYSLNCIIVIIFNCTHQGRLNSRSNKCGCLRPQVKKSPQILTNRVIYNQQRKSYFFLSNEKQTKKRQKCCVYNIFYNTFTINAK